MGASCDLTIIIVNWNVRDLLRRCLQSLHEANTSLETQIIVVDSASSDGSVEMVSDEFPQVSLLVQKENIGFTRGNNLGIADANSEYILLLNPDTVVDSNALEEMVAYMQEHPEVGVLGPLLVYPDGSIQSSRRRFPTLATLFFESTWLQPIAPRKVLDNYYVKDIPDDEVAKVGWIMGACMLVRQKAIDEAGPLDEGYFMYSEEMEWQRRIQDKGWQVVYYPQVRVVHFEGKSSEQVMAQRHIYFQQSKLRYARQYFGPFRGTLLRVFLLANYVWQMILESGKWIVGHKRTLRKQRIMAYWQVLQTGLAPAAPEQVRSK
ncbi:MAG: glycosyltransferase family 2 protein [Chloroflexota bacterium]